MGTPTDDSRVERALTKRMFPPDSVPLAGRCSRGGTLWTGCRAWRAHDGWGAKVTTLQSSRFAGVWPRALQGADQGTRAITCGHAYGQVGPGGRRDRVHAGWDVKRLVALIVHALLPDAAPMDPRVPKRSFGRYSLCLVAAVRANKHFGTCVRLCRRYRG